MRSAWNFAAAAALVVACGDDEAQSPATSAGPGPGSSSSTTGGNGGDGGDTTSNGGGGMGGGTGGAPTGGGGMGGEPTGGGGMGGSGGSMELPIHGCTSISATDLSGDNQVQITWNNPVTPPGKCILVDVGTEVEWLGAFMLHPLEGGVNGTIDPQSPISMAVPNGGMNSTKVTFNAAGTYPYFCTIHTATMQGVVYVQ
jgi:plastocyanin